VVKEGFLPGRFVGLAAGPGRVWVWTSAGLACVEGDRWQPLSWPVGERDVPTPLTVRAIAAGGDDGLLWVGTDQRLAVVWRQGEEVCWSLDELPGHREDALNNLARCVVPSPDGRTLVGTAGGLVDFKQDQWSLDPGAGDVRGLCVARGTEVGEASVYLLTWPGGVACRNSGGGSLQVLPQPEGVALALATGQDGRPYLLTTRALWGLEGGGWRAVGEGTDLAPCSLAQAPDERWWLGTPRGVFRLGGDGRWELAGEQPGPLGAEVHSLALVRGALWAGTAVGLWERVGDGWSAHPPEATEAVVRALAAAGDQGALWVAWEDRLTRYDPRTGKAEVVHTPAGSGLGSVRVTGLGEGGGFLWVATRSGVSRLHLDRERQS
jgi:hypothetical protein